MYIIIIIIIRYLAVAVLQCAPSFAPSHNNDSIIIQTSTRFQSHDYYTIDIMASGSILCHACGGLCHACGGGGGWQLVAQVNYLKKRT